MSDSEVSSGENMIEGVELSNAIADYKIRNPNPPTPLPRSRLTVVTKVYVNLPGENTIGPEPISYYRWLESEERPYSRTINVPEQWQALDLGWLFNQSIAYVVFSNDTKRPLGKVPEQSVIDEWRDKVIEVGTQIGDSGGVVEPILYFSPEEGLGLSPTSPKNLRVRCRKGTAKLTYYIVPG